MKRLKYQRIYYIKTDFQLTDTTEIFVIELKHRIKRLSETWNLNVVSSYPD